MLRDLPLAAWATKTGRAIFVLAGCRRTNGRPVDRPARLNCPLDRLSEILQQMEAVGDLTGLRSPFTRALGEQTAPISTDDFDLGAISRSSDRRRG